MESKVSEIIRESLGKIKDVVDVNTVVGEPIYSDAGVTIIPVSKVSVGTASGGLDRFQKNVAGSDKKAADKGDSFGGGGGIGMSVSPVGFLVIKPNNQVEFLSVAAANTASTAISIVDTVADFVDRSPELVDKFKSIFKKEQGGE